MTFHYFIFLSIFSLALIGCGADGKSEEELAAQKKRDLESAEISQKLAQERILLEQEKLKLEKQRLESENQLKREELVRNARLEAEFSDYSEAVVVINKSYFHTAATAESINKKKFLVSGDVCTVVRTKNGFGYIEYYNSDVDKLTTGWLDLRDLERMPAD
jgi:hypothetical protein